MNNIKQTAVGYYGQQVQRFAQELMGLGYSLSQIHSQVSAPLERGPTSSEALNIAGTAARLKTQIDHVLSQVQALALEGERVIPGDQKE